MILSFRREASLLYDFHRFRIKATNGLARSRCRLSTTDSTLKEGANRLAVELPEFAVSSL